MAGCGASPRGLDGLSIHPDEREPSQRRARHDGFLQQPDDHDGFCTACRTGLGWPAGGAGVLKYDIGSEIEDLTAPMVAVRGLTKVFPGGSADLSAVSEVSFDLEPGTFAAITGPSGSGKSTLLHLLGGIEKPTSGEIQVAGRAIQALRESELARFRLMQVGFIFQAFHLVPNLTIFNNVAMPGLLAGVAGGPLRQRVITLLETMGIRD